MDTVEIGDSRKVRVRAIQEGLEMPEYLVKFKLLSIPS